MKLAVLGAAGSLWDPALYYVWPALLLTLVGVVLRRSMQNPKTPRGDAVLFDLFFGLVAVAALVLWLQVFLITIF